MLVVVWSSRLLIGAPYFEAPGLALTTFANRHFTGTSTTSTLLYIGVAVVSVALFAGPRPALGRGASTALLVCAWLLTGAGLRDGHEHGYSPIASASDRRAAGLGRPGDRRRRGHLPRPEAQPDPNPLWLTEFWNRSLHHVGSHRRAPRRGPGRPRRRSSTLDRRVALRITTDDPYILAGPGVRPAAPVVAERDGITLYRTPSRGTCATSSRMFADGWATARSATRTSGRAAPGAEDRPLAHGLHRHCAAGPRDDRVGTVKLDEEGAPRSTGVIASRHAIVRNGGGHRAPPRAVDACDRRRRMRHVSTGLPTTRGARRASRRSGSSPTAL